MDAVGHRLGIDFGTSNTVAVARWPDGRVRPLLFDGAPLLPSAVVIDEGGALTAGREALHAARIHPEFFEPNPKRRIDEGTVLLGTHEVAVADLIGAVLRRVADEAHRVLAGRPEVVLTHPATWAAHRCQVLRDAAERAGLAAPALVAEPVAAGSYFVRVHGSRLPPGSVAVVYDLGAGTFDASVLRRTDTGFDVLACEGLPDAGGLDIDAALVAFLGAVYGSRNGSLWQRLERPASTADRRARRLFWDDVRGAKEALSRTSSSTVLIPLLDEDAPIGREQLERLARPILDRTVAATAHALRIARVRPADLNCIFLVGGASRIPLAATLLHTTFGVAPTVIEQPEMVVAEGSLHASPATWSPDPATAGPLTSGSLFPVPVSPPFSPAAPFSGSAPVPVAPVSAAPVSGSAPVPVAPVVPVSGSASMPVAPVSPPVSGPPVSGPPVPQPAAPRPAPAGEGERGTVPYRAILTAVGVLVAILVVLATDAAPEAFELGLTTVFTVPAIPLLSAQVLLVAGLAVRGRLVDPPHDPIGSAGRFAALAIAGHAVGMGLGLSRHEGDWIQDELVLAILGGVGLSIGGVGVAIGALLDRKGPPGGWQRYGVPTLLGLGSGLALLVSQAEPYNPAFFLVFRSGEGPARDLSRYLGFTAGALAILIVATVAAALLGRTAAVRNAGPTVRRTVNLSAAGALLLAGLVVVGLAASLLS